MENIYNGYAISIATEEISNDVTRVFTGPTTLPNCSYRIPKTEEIPIEVVAYIKKLFDEKKPYGVFDFKDVKYLLYHVRCN